MVDVIRNLNVVNVLSRHQILFSQAYQLLPDNLEEREEDKKGERE